MAEPHNRGVFNGDSMKTKTRKKLIAKILGVEKSDLHDYMEFAMHRADPHGSIAFSFEGAFIMDKGILSDFLAFLGTESAIELYPETDSSLRVTVEHVDFGLKKPKIVHVVSE